MAAMRTAMAWVVVIKLHHDKKRMNNVVVSLHNLLDVYLRCQVVLLVLNCSCLALLEPVPGSCRSGETPACHLLYVAFRLVVVV